MKRLVWLALLIPVAAHADDNSLGKLLGDATKHLRPGAAAPSVESLKKPGPDVLNGYTRLEYREGSWDSYLLGAALLPERPVLPKEWEMYVNRARRDNPRATLETVKGRIAKLAATRRFYFDGLIAVAWSEDMQLAVLTMANPPADFPKAGDVKYVFVFDGPHWTNTPLGAYRPDRVEEAPQRGTWGRSWQASVKHGKGDVLWSNQKLSRTFMTVGEPQFMQVDVSGQRIYRLPVKVDRVEYSDQVRHFAFTE
ncbi:hypothetical protein [Stenotrophomonas sp. TWI819]|uniref:hypothetical protein n=1 Tax=Stenotrophomonas sp. TWI819 TaxID=3136800 RepID=UPI003208C66C